MSQQLIWRIRRAPRRALIALAAFSVLGAIAVPAFGSGQYDYTLSIGKSAWQSRYVNHDYSYLRGNMAGATVCLSRNSTGQSFCGAGSIDHHYADSCNPSACISWYYNGDSVTRTVSIHDEWR